MVEMRLVATRSAAALSLGIDEYDLDKKFARNCVEERITTLQDTVRLAHQQMQGIQQEAEGAAAAAEVRRAEGALVQRGHLCTSGFMSDWGAAHASAFMT